MTIPWGPDVRGPYAAEQSLSRQPMKAGESRDLKMFIPDLNKICDVTLTAKASRGGAARRRRQAAAAPDRADDRARRQAPARVRRDPLGRLQAGRSSRARSDILGGMVTYRTTREAATAADGASELDQILHLDHQGHPQDPQSPRQPATSPTA